MLALTLLALSLDVLQIFEALAFSMQTTWIQAMVLSSWR